MIRNSLLTMAIVIGLFTCANAHAGTYPQRMAVEHNNGWQIVDWSAGQIYAIQKAPDWIEYETWQLSMTNVNSIFARVGKWGGSYGTTMYSDYKDFYFEELSLDNLYQSCPAPGHTYFGKTMQEICKSVDYSGTTENFLTTCYDDNNNAINCRMIQMTEYGAYNNNNIITYYDGGAGHHEARFAMMKYKYSSNGNWYYRTFNIYSLLS